MRQAAIVVALVFVGGCAMAQTAPTASEQAAVVSAIRDYARNYVKGLPDYTCTQTTRRSTIRPALLAQPGAFDTIEEQISFVDHQEIHKVSSLNGKPVPAGDSQVHGTVSRGEFAEILDVIFDPETGTDLRWDKTAKLDGRAMNVLRFRVPKLPRGYVLMSSQRMIQVPYEGFVYADAQTNEVRRLEMKCVDIPLKSDYAALSLTLDYRPAMVAGRSYILPAHYLMRFRTAQGEGTNDAEFKNYRKFSTAATISFEEVPQ